MSPPNLAVGKLFCAERQLVTRLQSRVGTRASPKGLPGGGQVSRRDVHCEYRELSAPEQVQAKGFFGRIRPKENIENRIKKKKQSFKQEKGNAYESMCTISRRKLSLRKLDKEDIDNQAKKSVRWMPWHQEPMKDVVSCDKPWEAASRRYIHGFPNGATRPELCLVTRT